MKKKTNKDPEFEEKWRNALINCRAYEMEARYQAKLAVQRERAEWERLLAGETVYADDPVPVEPAEERAERIATFKKLAELNMQKAERYSEMLTFLEDHTWKEWQQEQRRRYNDAPISDEERLARERSRYAEKIEQNREFRKRYNDYLRENNDDKADK